MKQSEPNWRQQAGELRGWLDTARMVECVHIALGKAVGEATPEEYDHARKMIFRLVAAGYFKLNRRRT